MTSTDEMSLFATACGASLPLRLRITDERSGEIQTVEIDKPFAVVGSADRSDVRLAHPEVSRFHAYLQAIDGRLLCCDLGSRTGTHWGSQIHSRNWVERDEPVQIGPFSLQLLEGDAGPAARKPLSQATGLERLLVQLSFVNARHHKSSTKATRVRHPVTLAGWGPPCNLRLQHHSVGRVHCSLVSTASGLWAVDLLRRGGTIVNGEPISFARLNEGDELTVGRFRLRIAYGSSTDLPLIEDAGGEQVEQEAGKGQMPAEPQAAAFETAPANGAGTSLLPGLRVPTMPAGYQPTLMPMSLPLPGALTQPGAADHVAMTLVQQFAIMQQQLFDHTQQLLTQMADTFQAAHTRQMDVIREELARVHELNRELCELNRQRSETAATPVAPAAAEITPASEAPAGKPLRSKHKSPAEGHVRASASVQATAASNSAGGKALALPAPGNAPSAAAASNDAHAWLTNRINELEHERSSRWQRIVQMLTQSRS